MYIYVNRNLKEKLRYYKRRLNYHSHYIADPHILHQYIIAVISDSKRPVAINTQPACLGFALRRLQLERFQLLRDAVLNNKRYSAFTLRRHLDIYSHVHRTFYMSPVSGVENRSLSTCIQKLSMFNCWTHVSSRSNDVGRPFYMSPQCGQQRSTCIMPLIGGSISPY